MTIELSYELMDDINRFFLDVDDLNRKAKVLQKKLNEIYDEVVEQNNQTQNQSARERTCGEDRSKPNPKLRVLSNVEGGLSKQGVPDRSESN